MGEHGALDWKLVIMCHVAMAREREILSQDCSEEGSCIFMAASLQMHVFVRFEPSFSYLSSFASLSLRVFVPVNSFGIKHEVSILWILSFAFVFESLRYKFQCLQVRYRRRGETVVECIRQRREKD